MCFKISFFSNSKRTSNSFSYIENFKNLVYSNEVWKTLFQNSWNDLNKKYKVPKLKDEEEKVIENWKYAVKVLTEEKFEWEFSQMFGEEDSESEESGSESGEGNKLIII